VHYGKCLPASRTIRTWKMAMDRKMKLVEVAQRVIDAADIFGA
jgi:AmiR/NasT family two-component response regulator